ncbi:VanW family protein [Actinacidiphila yeochonensis]|uniref:hypothetical protein n=1 Tax=Actinacidiphila yeochonensis TaxID=89050 RepID=UPI00055EE4BD|nr:hypothetical protein [Actinacidiphila yeochonensis]
MSRETDSTSSGPQGRGGAAYPSGTQPYGPRPFPALHPQERQRPAGQEQAGAGEDTPDATDEPKTETTLTTRIRINIPGSRPIPPVVVRTTVDGEASGAEPGAPEPAPEPAEQAAAEPEKPEKKGTSDWFAPRKPMAQPAPAVGDAPGGAESGFAAAPQTTPSAPAVPGGPAAPGGDYFGGNPAGDDLFSGPFAAPYNEEETAALPLPNIGSPLGDGARGSHDTQGAGFPGAFDTGSHASPFDTGSHAAPFDTGSHAAGGFDTGSHASPFDTGSHASPFDTGSHAAGGFDTGSHASPFDTGSHAAGGFDTGSHEVPEFDTGTHRVPETDTGSHPAPGFETGSHPAPGVPGAPFGPDDFPPGVPRPNPGAADEADPAGVTHPSGPTSGPATGSMTVPPLDATPAGGFDPGLPQAAPKAPRRRVDGTSGDTLVGGIPPVPPAGAAQPQPQPPVTASAPRPVPAPAPAPVPAPAPAPAPGSAAGGPPAKSAPAKKGRSKVALLGAGVCAVAAVAYGAGLLMNHADVPKGTTVLGVDIGNMNQDAAVKTLDDTLGGRASAPLVLTVDGKKETLKPSVAGLSIDTDATVQKVAHADYNPVTVIETLVGRTHPATPVIDVDGDKLRAALQGVAGRTGSASEGMVTFTDGTAKGVPGKPGKSLDVNAAAAQVSAAYRQRAASGQNTPIALATATVPPKVTQAELDKAVNGFGRTAMSGPITITGGGQRIDFLTTVPQFLTMQAAPDGQLAPHVDLKALQALYGQIFSGVLLERGNGSKTAVTPQDVATAVVQALGSQGAGRTVDLSETAGQ